MADDLLGAAVGLLEDGANGDVLADGEAEDRGGVGELESVAGVGVSIDVIGGTCGGESFLHGDIVGDDGLFLELKVLELVGLEDLGGDCEGIC